jgi:hypothetical protein
VGSLLRIGVAATGSCGAEGLGRVGAGVGVAGVGVAAVGVRAAGGGVGDQVRARPICRIPSTFV